MKAFLTMLKIESMLVIRSMDTVFFGIGFPAVVAVFMGILVKNPEIFYGSFAAVSTIGICATGLMGIPLTIADYRHRKILKRYSVTPVSPLLILLAQFIINLVIALLSLLAVYLIMAVCFGFRFRGSVIYFLLSFGLITFAMYGFGMMVASVSRNVKTANTLCTVIYFPMIFLSGTVVPYEVMPGFLQTVMDFGPLRQGIALLNRYAAGADTALLLPVIYLSAVGVVSTVIAIKTFRWI